LFRGAPAADYHRQIGQYRKSIKKGNPDARKLKVNHIDL
jgi:hypothetical protein